MVAVSLKKKPWYQNSSNNNSYSNSPAVAATTSPFSPPQQQSHQQQSLWDCPVVVVVVVRITLMAMIPNKGSWRRWQLWWRWPVIPIGRKWSCPSMMHFTKHTFESLGTAAGVSLPHWSYPSPIPLQSAPGIGVARRNPCPARHQRFNSQLINILIRGALYARTNGRATKLCCGKMPACVGFLLRCAFLNCACPWNFDISWMLDHACYWTVWRTWTLWHCINFDMKWLPISVLSVVTSSLAIITCPNWCNVGKTIMSLSLLYKLYIMIVF